MSWDEGVETELMWEGGPGMRVRRQGCYGEERRAWDEGIETELLWGRERRDRH